MSTTGWNDSRLYLGLCNPALRPASEQLAAEIAAKHVKAPAIEMILANIIADPESCFRFSRTRDDYRIRKYHSFTREHVVKSIEGLVCLGHLQEIDGGFGQQNTIRATMKILELLAAVPTSVSENQFREVIVLKDFDPKCNEDIEIDYEDTDEIRQMRADLMAYNARMSEHDVRDTNGQRHSTPLVRIFNRSNFRLGGRFYRASYQNMPKELRAKLTIDGKTLVECDYSALHPRLLYHSAGLEAPKDLYEVEGFDRRKLKLAFNTALNANDRDQAVFALAEKHFGGDLRPAYQYLDAAMGRHPAIAEHFFTGVGLKLQRLDSDIANEILHEFVGAQKPILVEHDSFLVKDEDEAKLIAAMKAVYQKANPKGFEPCIEKK